MGNVIRKVCQKESISFGHSEKLKNKLNASDLFCPHGETIKFASCQI